MAASADPVAFDKMAEAVETFEAALITSGPRVDRFLKRVQPNVELPILPPRTETMPKPTL